MQNSSISLKLTVLSTLFVLVGMVSLGWHAFDRSSAMVEHLQKNALLDSAHITALAADVRDQRQVFLLIGLVIAVLGMAAIFLGSPHQTEICVR